MLSHSALDLGLLLVRQFEVVTVHIIRHAVQQPMPQLKAVGWIQFHDLVDKRFVHNDRIILCPQPRNVSPAR